MKSKKRLLSSVIPVAKTKFIQLILCLMLCSPFIVSASEPQGILDKKVTLSVRDQTLQYVVSLITKQTGVNVSFSAKTIKSNGSITLSVNEKKLGDVLSEDLASFDIGYRLVNEQIVLFQESKTAEISSEPSVLFASYPHGTADVVITGIVNDENGKPLGGVSVSEKGTGNAVISKEDGSFRISVKSTSSILVFSYVGHASKEMAVGNQSAINVALTFSNKDLEDVVVVGYGTQKKATNTGAQASMGGKLLVQTPAANISNALVGRLPGLFASQATGEPGNDRSTLRIRGVGTFNGSQEPLVLVDGIQVDNYNNIDANEIENVTILKDASSTAVYGIRGANGVLIITTKRGKTGPAKISYTFNNAINSFTALKSQMNSFDYTTSFNKALEGDAYLSGAAFTPRYSAADIAKYKSGEDPIFFPNVDWYKVILKKTSGQQQHNLNINGGTDKVRYAVSAGMFNQEGLFNNTNLNEEYDAQARYKRFNFRSNLNFAITKRFKAAIDISSQTENRSGLLPNGGGSFSTIIDNIARANPTISPGIVDGRLISLTTAGGNPIQSMYQDGYLRDYRNYLNGNVRLDHDLDFITKGLTTHVNIAYQNFNSQRFQNRKGSITTVVIYIPLRLADGSVVFLPQNDDGPFLFNESIGKNRRTTSELGINYKRRFGVHNVTGLLLYNQQKSINPDFTFLVPSGYQSYVGRGTYDYKGKYLAEVNIAYNGTENFAPGNRFGLFPAYSVGWLASEESFFPKNNIISFLKFRASYGEVGNDQIGGNFLSSNNRFLYRPTAWTFGGGSRFGEVPGSYNQLPGVQEGRASNPNLTWERAVKSNLGVEMSFWKKNITLNVDVFEETRDNILANRQTVSSIIGIAIPPENLGKMRNRGYEIDFTLDNNIGKFNYQVKANYSFARNKILFQDEVTPLFAYQARTGQRFGQYFGLLNDGFFNTWDEVNDPKRPLYEWQNNRIQPGDIRYKDINGDGKINLFDQAPIGTSQVPEKTYGFSLVGEYKGFSLSVLFQGVANVSLPYTRRNVQAFYDGNPAGAPDYLINSWTKERYDAGLPIQFPRFSLGTNGGAVNNYQSNDFFTVDASYVRLKNMELGYSFDGKALKKIGLSSARVFVNANNLFTWSNVYKGIDPENPPTPGNEEPYPLIRTVNMGVNINF